MFYEVFDWLASEDASLCIKCTTNKIEPSLSLFSAEVESCIRTFKDTELSWQTDGYCYNILIRGLILASFFITYILLHNNFPNCILTKFTSVLVTIIAFSYVVLCRCRAVGSTSVVLKKSKYLCEMFHVVSLKLLLHRRCVNNWQQKLVIFVR